MLKLIITPKEVKCMKATRDIAWNDTINENDFTIVSQKPQYEFKFDIDEMIEVDGMKGRGSTTIK